MMSGMPTDQDQRTPKRRLIDDRLARRRQPSLAEMVATERAAGTSWRRIANEVTKLTGEDVAAPTLILWFPELTHEAGQ